MGQNNNPRHYTGCWRNLSFVCHSTFFDPERSFKQLIGLVKTVQPAVDHSEVVGYSGILYVFTSVNPENWADGPLKGFLLHCIQRSGYSASGIFVFVPNSCLDKLRALNNVGDCPRIARSVYCLINLVINSGSDGIIDLKWNSKLFCNWSVLCWIAVTGNIRRRSGYIIPNCLQRLTPFVNSGPVPEGSKASVIFLHSVIYPPQCNILDGRTEQSSSIT